MTMEILTILCTLSINYITLDAYERVARAAICPRFTADEFPGGRIKYKRKGTRAAFRCPKRFNRYGPKFATCQSDGTWSTRPPLCTKTGCVPLDPSQVTNLDMEVINGAVVEFSCLENYILIGVTQTYCNGKDWNAPLPRCAAPHELTECDFEDDLCGWTQDDNEEQDWQRNVGATQTENTGPKHDHTLGDIGNGHYLYFETSNPSMTGHQASLLSPVFTEDLSPMCFDFWYHILGPDEEGHVGSLEVFVLDQSQNINDDDIHPLFYIDGNQGDQWHRGEISIDKQDEPYQIAIVATRALSYISNIAIDDVRLHNCTKSTTSPPVSSPRSSPKPAASSESSPQTTAVTQKKETISPTTIKTETTVTTKTPTGTIVKKETTESQTPQVANASTSANTQPVNTSTETTTTTFIKVSTSSDKTPTVASSTKAESTSKVTMESQSSQSTPKPSYTQTTTTRTGTTQPLPQKTTKERTTEKTTEKMKTSRPSSASSSPTTVSSPTTIHTASSAMSTTKSPMTSTTVTSMITSIKASTSTPSKEQTSTTKSSSKATNGSSSTTTSTTSSTSSSSSTTFSFSSTRSSSSSSTTITTTTTFSSSSSSRTTETSKSTGKSNNSSKDNSITVSEGRSQHPEDDTLKPLMIGLCVGIVAGLIIIGVIAYVCVRRRKFHTSRHEDELNQKNEFSVAAKSE